MLLSFVMPPFAKVVVLLSALFAIGGWMVDQREAKLEIPHAAGHERSVSG